MSSLFELVGGLTLSAVAVYFVLRPIFLPSRPIDDAAFADGGDDPDDDLSARAVALRALKEIEFDRATGKLADADYDSLKQKYTTEALDALRVESPGDHDIGQRLAAPSAAAAAPTCAIHGARVEPAARFCCECGRRLSDARAFCVHCGTPLKPDARFCESCGRRSAA